MELVSIFYTFSNLFEAVRTVRPLQWHLCLWYCGFSNTGSRMELSPTWPNILITQTIRTIAPCRQLCKYASSFDSVFVFNLNPNLVCSYFYKTGKRLFSVGPTIVNIELLNQLKVHFFKLRLHKTLLPALRHMYCSDLVRSLPQSALLDFPPKTQSSRITSILYR